MNAPSVKRQLAIAFASLAATVLLISAWGLYGIGQVNKRFTDYLNGASARRDLVLEARVMTNRRAIAVRDMVVVKTEADLASSKAMALDAHKALADLLVQLKRDVSAADVSEKERQQVERILQVEATYNPVAARIVELAASGQREQAMDLMTRECRPLLASLLSALQDYSKNVTDEGLAIEKASDEAYASQRRWMLLFCGLAVVGASLLGWVITRRLMASLGTEPAVLGEVAGRVAHGDLRPVEGAATAPAGSVLFSMGEMQQQLLSLIQQVRSSAGDIATASAEIAHGNSDLSSRTEEQASTLEETAASMEELSATVRQNADNARQANQLAQGASEVATKGGDVVSRVVETMRGINDSSKRIADITGVIDSIAFQTNILALNAAVEAARAGEQGRGFAVVASEVRSLASRSAEAAREIKSLIGVSVERVAEGSTLVDHAGTTMQEVVAAIHRVTDIMGEITAASVEQSAGVTQVGTAVSKMDRTTQQNAALVEESAAAAASLQRQAEKMVEAIAVFRTGDETATAMPISVAPAVMAERVIARASAATAVKSGAGGAPNAAGRTQSAARSAAPAVRSSAEPAPRVPSPAKPAAVAAAAQGNDDEWTAF